jgi:TRAP-type transport system small permease protein
MSEQIVEKRVGRVGRILDKLNGGLTYASMFTLTIIMLLTTGDAFGRYILNSPIIGAVEFTGEYLLVATVFLAMAFSYHEGVFVRVTILVGKLSPRVRFVVDHIVQGLSALICIVFLYGTVLQAVRMWSSKTTTNSSIGYVLWPAYAIVMLGVALMALMVTADLFQVRHGQSAMFMRENELGGTA